MIWRVPCKIYPIFSGWQKHLRFSRAWHPFFSDLPYETQLFLRLPPWKNSGWILPYFFQGAKSIHLFKTKNREQIKGTIDEFKIWPNLLQILHPVGFWCQTIHKKFLRRFDPIFGLKMMVKSGLEKIILKFHDGLQSCCCPVQKKIYPERLNWPGRLAGISEGHRGISKYFFLDHFLSSFLGRKYYFQVHIPFWPGTPKLNQWRTTC